MPLHRAPKFDAIGQVPKRRKGGPSLKHRALVRAGSARVAEPGIRQDALRAGMQAGGVLLGLSKSAHDAFEI